MSEIRKLIERLCPDGVEYKKLGEVCEIKTGKLNANAQVENGLYPFYTCDAKPFRIDTYAFDTEAIIISGNGSQVGHVNYYKGKFNAYQRTYILDNFRLFNILFVLHYLKGTIRPYIIKKSKKGSVPYITLPMLTNFEIPVPPIEVQSKIVEILDNFTELEAELEIKLEAELEARRKQYEYYRNQLLTFDKVGGVRFDVKWMKIMDVCSSICSGGTPSTSNRSYYEGNIPWLRTQEVDWTEIYDTSIKISQEALDNSSAKMIPANCVIVAMYGATAAKVAINRIPLCTNQACCNLEINENVVLIKYVYQWLCKEYEKLKSLGEGSQHNINAQKVKKYPIPIPPLSEQERIVSILDRFEALTTDLQSGLPAEIEARRKQYEYYREKLLSFKRKEN